MKNPPSWRAGWRPHLSATERQRVSALEKLLDWAENESGDFGQIMFAVLGRYREPHGLPTIRPPTNEQEQQFREWLLTGLRAVARGLVWNTELPALSISITKDGPRYESRDELDLRRYAVAQIVASQYWRIAACKRPGCGVLFIKTGRSEYHDPRCASAARSAKYLATKKIRRERERFERRIAQECPDKRPADAHIRDGGYQHRVRPDNTIICLPWGERAEGWPRSETQWRLEEIVNRVSELGREPEGPEVVPTDRIRKFAFEDE